MKVYISGDTSGLPQVKYRFEDAEAYLTKNNHIPVNPFKIDRSKLAPLPVRMEALAGCDAIFLLTDWISCDDSKIEKYYSDITGKAIMFESRIEEGKKQFCKEEVIVSGIKGAIHEVTGMSFEEYAKDDRVPGKRLHKCKPTGFFCRMLFSVQYQKAGFDTRRVLKYIPRDYTSILHYLRKYDSEYQYNKEFRDMADKVNCMLYPSQDPTMVNETSTI